MNRHFININLIRRSCSRCKQMPCTYHLFSLTRRATYCLSRLFCPIYITSVCIKMGKNSWTNSILISLIISPDLCFEYSTTMNKNIIDLMKEECMEVWYFVWSWIIVILFGIFEHDGIARIKGPATPPPLPPVNVDLTLILLWSFDSKSIWPMGRAKHRHDSKCPPPAPPPYN